MSRPIVFTEEARRDIEEARSWYRQRNVALARDFTRSLRACLDGVERFPERHPIVHRSVRRAMLRRYPYMILYAILGESTAIIGCFHLRRNPRDWSAR